MYDTLFERIWYRTSYLEGFAKVSKDLGGKTKYGICWVYDKEYLIPMGYTTEDSIGLLTQEDAKEIYFKKYWIKWKFIKLSSLPELAMTIFDMGFHEGKFGWMTFQKLCNDVLLTNLKLDGAFGPNTNKALDALKRTTKEYPSNGFNAYNLAIQAEAIRADYYKQMFNDPEDNGYGNFVEYNSGLRRLGHVGNKMNLFTV